MGILARCFLHCDDVANLNLIRGDVNLASVHEHVSVIHQLACLPARGREAGPIYGVVQPALQKKQQIFTSYSFLARGAFEVVAKLPFENEVDAFHFLLFPQLLAVAHYRLAATQRVTVLSRRLCTALFDWTRW